ncbi:MAG: dethiobiotin synthase [Candidatus Binatia bacterium]
MPFPSPCAGAYLLMPARGIFLTGTDTGAGKTLVSCAILGALRRRGLRVAAYKPVETGCRQEVGGRVGERVGEDCERLAAAVGDGTAAADIASYLFAEPAAPLVAAEAEGRLIDPGALLARFAEIAGAVDFVLVESAGGLMVPVAHGYTTLDLACDLGLPAVCVVASRLGCINHALLTMEVLRAKGLPVAGFVMNEIGGDAGHALARRTNHDMIRRFTAEADLGAMPFVDPAVRDDTGHLAALAERHLDLDAILAAGRRTG